MTWSAFAIYESVAEKPSTHQSEDCKRRRGAPHEGDNRKGEENACDKNEGNQELPRASKSHGIASRTGAPQCKCKDCKRGHRRTLYRALVAWVVKSVARMLAENALPHPEEASCIFYVSASVVIQRYAPLELGKLLIANSRDTL